MSSLVFSIPTAATTANTATGNAQSAASSSGRARDAQSPTDADGFGAALARTRDARSPQAQDKAQPDSSGAPSTTGRRRTLASDAQREEASPAELLAMAMLTPTFSTQAAHQQQARTAGGQASELAARTTVGAAATTATDEPLAAADAPAAETDARATAQASTAAAQAAGTQAADEQDGDAKNTIKAKAETPAAASDAKTPVAVLPSVATTPVQGTAAAATPGAQTSSGAAATAAGNSAKTTADSTALSLQASEAAPAEHHADTASDTPALPPGMLNFKTALGEATNVQTATAAQAQAVPRFNVPTPVGSEGWGADIGTQMIRMGADGHHVAELSLNPAGLGPLKVTLTLGDNQAQAMFVSAHESVRRAVEAALPQLRDTLAGQGIQLGQASVDAGTQQQQAFGQERGSETPARPGSRGAQQATAIEAEPARTANRSRASSGIDTFA